MSYQDTSLWKRTLGKKDKNVTPLRKSFIDARKNAEFLLNKIREDFPNLTVHDITHVDSLWNVANTIIGDAYPINPLEGYVLGIAFLIHDAALSYDAVGGKEKLRNTIEWKDAYADGPGEKDEAEFKKECDFAAIRAIHAREAEEILFKLFTKDNGSTFYIIDNDSYRKHFGSLIGKIAASHHWDIDRVGSELKKQINPRSEMPNDWKINAQKLACILRCADAGHIDDGRAPDAIYQSLLVNGVSRYHWESQNHLCQVCEDDDNPKMLCITSISPFEKKDFDAWNVAYDAIRLFDEELKKSNNLLIANHIKEFPHNGVSGANSKEDLAKYIETEGWQPCNFGVHTSNIKYLIKNLGGSKLYGEDNMLLVALRELIQNARDAIHARQKMDSFNDGRITVRLIEENNNRFIEVEDNGIGMSLDCIKHNLLDFGSSYWKSSLSKYENPGLRSSGFTSIGKFGIGFYSIFMVAKSVEVITRRYDVGVDDAKLVEFPEGLTLAPIISDSTLVSGMSTKVKFYLKDQFKDLSFSFKVNMENDIFMSDTFVELSFKEALRRLVIGLDMDVFLNNKRIHTNIQNPMFNKKTWVRDVLYLIDEPDSITEISSKLDFIKDSEGRIRGLICINEGGQESNYESPFVTTIGGLLSFSEGIHDLFGIAIGYLDCTESDISRNHIIIDDSLKKSLQLWYHKKYIQNYTEIINSDVLAYRFSIFRAFAQVDVTSLLEHNAYKIYKNYSNIIEVGTLNGLLSIHYYLFSGIYGLAGQLSGYHAENEIEMNKVLGICNLPELNYEKIISKFLMMSMKSPFVNGKTYAERIWLNLMLHNSCGQMINWKQVSIDQFNHYFSIFEEETDYEPMCVFLKQYLCKTEQYLNDLVLPNNK